MRLTDDTATQRRLRRPIDPYRTTYHRDGTVTYWCCYTQVWGRCDAGDISDQTLATFSHAERDRIARMVVGDDPQARRAWLRRVD